MSKVLLRSLLCANLVSILAAGVPTQVFAAGAQSELADIITRMDYGYYAGEARLIEAARDDLERIRAGGAREAYYLGYASYRLSQLGAAESHRRHRDLLAGCLDSAKEAVLDPEWALEAWVLVAACSLQGLRQQPARQVSYQLRVAEALSAARQLDRNNPRLLLISAWAESSANVETSAAEQRGMLEQARSQFDAWRDEGLAPTWGKAEVLASLGKAYLDMGELRNARDLIEQSLIEAPEYHVALKLRNALSLPR